MEAVVLVLFLAIMTMFMVVAGGFNDTIERFCRIVETRKRWKNSE